MKPKTKDAAIRRKTPAIIALCLETNCFIRCIKVGGDDCSFSFMHPLYHILQKGNSAFWSCDIVDVMFKQSGFSKIIIVVFVGIVLLGGGAIFVRNQQPSPIQPNRQQGQNQYQQNQYQQDNQYQGYGFKRPFYSKDGVSFQHYWPGDGSFSNEETEILLFNESSTNVEVTSFALVYSVEGRPYPHKSGTWEKFPSKQSWDRIEYLNISPQYYKGEQLLLTPGQKGKLHWHIQFGPNPLDGKQTVKVNLTLIKEGQTTVINETLTRASGSVYSSQGH